MNKIFLIGNLTKDPELSIVGKDKKKVCKFTLAVNSRETISADFFPIAVWEGLGENCAKYLRKGSKVCVVGPVKINSYEAADNTKRQSIEVVAEEVKFLSSPKEEKQSNAVVQEEGKKDEK